MLNMSNLDSLYPDFNSWEGNLVQFNLLALKKFVLEI